MTPTIPTPALAAMPDAQAAQWLRDLNDRLNRLSANEVRALDFAAHDAACHADARVRTLEVER